MPITVYCTSRETHEINSSPAILGSFSTKRSSYPTYGLFLCIMAGLMKEAAN